MTLIYPQSTWDNGNIRNSFLCLLFWLHLTQIWHQWSTFYHTLWQKRRLQLCHYKFPHLDSNISSAAAYGVYISQLICHAWACSVYSDFFQRHRILSS
jgi:hypothetical protein